MNISFTFRALAIIFVFGLVLNTQSCSKLEDLASGTTVYIETDVLLNPLTIQIVDAHLGIPLPADISVEVVGKDKDKIFSIMGERTLFVDTNRDDEVAAILPIGVRRIENFSVDNPLEFTLKIKAEGYMEAIESFSIVSERNKMKTVRLLNLANPVQSISKETSDFLAPVGGLSADLQISSSMNEEEEMVTIDMEEGTELYDIEGNKLSGDVHVDLIHYDIHSGEALQLLPGGTSVANARDKQGNSLGNMTFRPMGAISLDMYVGDKEVSAFSEPIEVTFYINGDMKNVETGQNVKEGDLLEIYSFNELIAEWQMEGEVNVSKDAAGNLVASYLQPHLSTWFIGGGRGCGRAPATKIFVTNTDVPEDSGERFYLTALYDADTDELVSTESFRFFDGEEIRLVRTSAFSAYFKIFEGATEDCFDQELFTSAVFETCDDEVYIDLTGLLNAADFVQINVEVRGSCSTDFNELVISPTLPILYRPDGCDTWNTLGVLLSGKGNTKALQKGEMYDFRISYRGLERCLLGLEVPASNTTIEINSPVYDFQETIEVVYDADGKSIDFIYTDIDVPDLACQEYVDTFGVDSDSDSNGGTGGGRPGDDD
ncbi:MAG: hypothetical protein MK226_16755 [Saprospiraceae bacterium]|nr:hypothetical protein [Saprospiraceae bacterium]